VEIFPRETFGLSLEESRTSESCLEGFGHWRIPDAED
jgi:hypothetical protein